MPQIEIGSDTSVTLRSALLIYESDAHEDNEVVITEHKVENGLIQPGAPLDVAAFRKKLDGRGDRTPAAGRGGWRWQFPRMVAENDEWRVWWSPSCIKSVFIGEDGRKPKVQEAWIPPLVWSAHRTRPLCYLFAYNGDSSPNAETDVYRPAFGPKEQNHIHSGSDICVGSMKLTGSTPESWETAFWNARFKTPGNLKSTTPYACQKVFKKIGSLTTALSRCRASD